MTLSTRAVLIQTALETLEPLQLNIEDDSADHEGHSSAKGGGHFGISIISKQFTGKSAVQRHRMIYAALGELMITDIHAIRIEAKAPEEE